MSKRKAVSPHGKLLVAHRRVYCKTEDDGYATIDFRVVHYGIRD